MNFTESQTTQLMQALKVCKIAGIEGAVIGEGMIRGVKTSLDSAIISNLDLALGDKLIGVGRVDELLKRLTTFDRPSVELTINERGTVSSLTIKSGKSKMQYRCTAPSMIRYPKSNSDPDSVVITMSVSEVKQLVKAVNTMGGEHVVLSMNRSKTVRVESLDDTNDRFETDLETEATVVDGETESFVFNYLTQNLSPILNQADATSEVVTLTIGVGGSLTVSIQGHTVMVMPQLGDDDYEDD